jgi:hypothetical protein
MGVFMSIIFFTKEICPELTGILAGARSTGQDICVWFAITPKSLQHWMVMVAVV